MLIVRVSFGATGGRGSKALFDFSQEAIYRKKDIDKMIKNSFKKNRLRGITFLPF